MTSPALRHYQRMVAAQEAAAAAPEGEIVGTAYELQLAKLYDDKRRLSDIQSLERKIEVKREILPDYDTWIDGVLDAGTGSQDQILVTTMVWHIDVGNYDEAMRIAQYVVKHDLKMPDDYQRTVPTLLVDEISDAALAAQKAETPFPLQILLELAALTADCDMPDQARAKLHRAIGVELQAQGNAHDAKEHYERALQLDERSGVKRQLDAINKELGKAS